MESHGPEISEFKRWEDALPALKEWGANLNIREQGNRRAASRFTTLNRVLGGLNIILAAFTATAVFAALNRKVDQLSFRWQVGITMLAVLPAITSGLQKEWQVAARGQGHLQIAYECRKLAKELSFLLAFPPADYMPEIKKWHSRYVDVISRPALAQLQ